MAARFHLGGVFIPSSILDVMIIVVPGMAGFQDVNETENKENEENNLLRQYKDLENMGRTPRRKVYRRPSTMRPSPRRVDLQDGWIHMETGGDVVSAPIVRIRFGYLIDMNIEKSNQWHETEHKFGKHRPARVGRNHDRRLQGDRRTHST